MTMATSIDQLEAMRDLPENWDGYGGAAPRAEMIDAAIQFLRSLTGGEVRPEPFVTPTRTGGVLLAWELGPHQLEVEFDTSDKGSYVYLNQQTGETATGTVSPARMNGTPPFALRAIMAALPVTSGV
jgi:hypothetical protein